MMFIFQVRNGCTAEWFASAYAQVFITTHLDVYDLDVLFIEIRTCAATNSIF